MSTITVPRLRPTTSRQWRMPSAGSIAAVTFAGLLIALGILGPSMFAHDPNQISLTDRLAPPIGFGGSWAHPLGQTSSVVICSPGSSPAPASP